MKATNVRPHQSLTVLVCAGAQSVNRAGRSCEGPRCAYLFELGAADCMIGRSRCVWSVVTILNRFYANKSLINLIP